MPQQHLASFDQSFKGSSFVRMLLDDGAEYLDFLLDKRPVQRGQPFPLVDSECVTGQDNALVDFHSTTFHISRKGQG